MHAAWLPLLLCAAWLPLLRAEYHVGDFVPTARRAQFQGTRTQWHDVLGKHCPKFGHTKTVAVPLPRPLALRPGEEYKLALAFDGDRFLTPWLTLLGRRAPDVPLVDVELTHTGGSISAVHAKALPVPPAYLRLHEELIREFRNDTHWPKHVLVHYRWREVSAVDSVAGLYTLFALGLAFTGAALGSAVFANARPLASFFTEIVEQADASVAAAPPLGALAKTE